MNQRSARHRARERTCQTIIRAWYGLGRLVGWNRNRRANRRGSAAGSAQGTPDDDSTVEGEFRKVDDDTKESSSDVTIQKGRAVRMQPVQFMGYNGILAIRVQSPHSAVR